MRSSCTPAIMRDPAAAARILERWHAAWNAHDADAILALITQDIRAFRAGGTAVGPGARRGAASSPMVTTVSGGLRSVRLLVAFVVVVALGLGAAAGARADVFWTNQQTGTIGRANPDGSSPNQSLITALGSPNGIAVAGGFIYWANASTNSIGRANADGTGANATFITGASSPVGVAVDGQFVYWANQGSNSIGRATLAGAGAGPPSATTRP
jgi:hypothetical protein